jgi:transposase
MVIKETVGIDVSKLTLDVTIYSTKAHLQCENSQKGYKQLVKWVTSNSSFADSNTLYLFEHTGLYSHRLAIYLAGLQIPFSIVSGLEIKRSLGIVRSKNDKDDSRSIAQYGFRLKDEIGLYKMPTDTIYQLQRLLSLREKMVKQSAGHKSYLKEIKLILVQKENKVLFKETQKAIQHLTKSIVVIDTELQAIIKADNELNITYKLLTSIKGVGPQVAMFTIVYTNNFTRFKTSRQFASYCGVAPFTNSSGTSLRGKTKVSNLANKKLKSLLDMSAKTAIQFSPEMKTFYERRQEMGKSKMSTINIIRNKIISRMFAVVKRQSPYVDLMKYAA